MKFKFNNAISKKVKAKFSNPRTVCLSQIRFKKPNAHSFRAKIQKIVNQHKTNTKNKFNKDYKTTSQFIDLLKKDR